MSSPVRIIPAGLFPFIFLVVLSYEDVFMKQNKWLNGAIPALLLHCSIGTVYCWSIFSQEIANYIGFSKSAIEWAFSFAIFFLGMSAAFLGRFVEKDIHKSSLISAITFTLGMLGTGFFIRYGGMHKHSAIALLGIYVCYGLIMGIGLGTGYISPVKTLMLWFKDNKGLATGLAVAGFGAAKAIASPIMQRMLSTMGIDGIYKMFYILAIVYFVMMMLGHFLLEKPADWIEPSKLENSETVKQSLKKYPWSVYIGIWLMFYINIACGLAIISQEKMIVQCLGLGVFVGVISTISAIFNAAGRVGWSALGDKADRRDNIFLLIFLLSGSVSILSAEFWATWFVVLTIFIINAGYGGGFSNVAPLLSDIYGMNNISAIHGLTLSAWAIAGLTGNQLANFIVQHTGEFINAGGVMVNPSGYRYVLAVTCFLYVVAYFIGTFTVCKKVD